MNTYEINGKRHLLEQLIDSALIDSMKWIHRRCEPQEPEEPDYILALTTNFTSSLFNILKTVFPLFEFNVTGVYCHQKPIVEFEANKKPELGDLLLLYIDKSAGEIRYNSLLLQAKISSEPKMKIPSKEYHQLELYSKWPEFKYFKAGNLNGQKRDVVPKTINDGAQYLLIDNNPITNGLSGFPNTYPMGCAVPSKTLYINNSFSHEIVDFLKFKSGRAITKDYRTTNDDWTKMIWDLLHISSAMYSKRINAGISSFPRQNECAYFSSDFKPKSSPLYEFHETESCLYDNNRNCSDEDRGVPIIVIESNEQLERERYE